MALLIAVRQIIVSYAKRNDATTSLRVHAHIRWLYGYKPTFHNFEHRLVVDKFGLVISRNAEPEPKPEPELEPESEPEPEPEPPESENFAWSQGWNGRGILLGAGVDTFFKNRSLQI